MAARSSRTSSSGLVAFATVGTTRFDLFCQKLDTAELQAALLKQGVGKLVVQKGNSSVTPRSRVAGLSVEAFEFSNLGLQPVGGARLYTTPTLLPPPSPSLSTLTLLLWSYRTQVKGFGVL